MKAVELIPINVTNTVRSTEVQKKKKKKKTNTVYHKECSVPNCKKLTQ